MKAAPTIDRSLIPDSRQYATLNDYIAAVQETLNMGSKLLSRALGLHEQTLRRILVNRPDAPLAPITRRKLIEGLGISEEELERVRPSKEQFARQRSDSHEAALKARREEIIRSKPPRLGDEVGLLYRLVVEAAWQEYEPPSSEGPVTGPLATWCARHDIHETVVRRLKNPHICVFTHTLKQLAAELRRDWLELDALTGNSVKLEDGRFRSAQTNKKSHGDDYYKEKGKKGYAAGLGRQSIEERKRVLRSVHHSGHKLSTDTVEKIQAGRRKTFSQRRNLKAGRPLGRESQAKAARAKYEATKRVLQEEGVPLSLKAIFKRARKLFPKGLGLDTIRRLREEDEGVHLWQEGGTPVD